MNRKNLTAAVLAGLAGAAGIAGTAQAVNLNPDGLGQVLIYPYYTANDGNQTILSVINTTDNAKAVKVRFLEGFNSREVLDFNLYLSHHDVWTAAIGLVDGTTSLVIGDDSCTAPYFYGNRGDDELVFIQPFLDLAFKGDGGPTSIARAAEGHFEMIEMGTIPPTWNGLPNPAYEFITHDEHAVLDEDGDAIEALAFWAPGNNSVKESDYVPGHNKNGCDFLEDYWSDGRGSTPDGIWRKEALAAGDCLDSDGDFDELADCQATSYTTRNSGGLFGGAAVINPNNGTMYSYDPKALQGFDKSDDGLHHLPGNIYPNLGSGTEKEAWVFFGVPQNKAVPLTYLQSVDAVSAVFMHENLFNDFTTDDATTAATEWVVTFPTKKFYVDEVFLPPQGDVEWIPTEGSTGCGGWVPGDPYPLYKPLTDPPEPIDGPGPWNNPGWSACVYEQSAILVDPTKARAPFTELWDGEACELIGLKTWDRDERSFSETRGGSLPPVVSPSVPTDCNSDIEFCETTPFELCYEVNVVRFGERSVFGTPVVDEQSLLVTVNHPDPDDLEFPFEPWVDGWGWLDFGYDSDHVDYADMVGLPVTGFGAWEFENGFAEGGTVKAFYGGLFQHKGSVRRE
jgi:hypothetical protein